MTACSYTGKDVAPEKNYYFTVQTPVDDTGAEKIRTYLEANIPKQKYTITNQSGGQWPFYQGFDLNEKIHPDSLMPPHWFVHRMLLKDDGGKIDTGEYFVEIEILPEPDTLLNFNVSVFLMKENGLELTATSGVHYIDTTLYQKKDWLQFLQQSVVRYSFK